MIDPVCGVQLDDQQSAIASPYMNRIDFFCSLGCNEQFDRDSDSYAILPAHGKLPDDETLAGQGPMGQSPLDPDATES